MMYRALTQEEFAVAGVSMRLCGNCGAEKRNDSGWVYFRHQGAPKVLCCACFGKACGWERGKLWQKADYLGFDAASYNPPQAARISGLAQKTPEAVERVFRELRDLSPDEIRGIAFAIASGPRPGDCLEWYGPVRWFSILDCLKWLREIHDIKLRYLFGRWAKLNQVLDGELQGEQYTPWKSRIVDLASSEFLFRYSVLLSDAIEAALKKGDQKKNPASKMSVFQLCKAAVLEHAPPETLAGSQDELARFIDYMDAIIERTARLD